MSMIARYKKAGGFVQLLKLIETSGKAKQEKFLKIIEDEDKVWVDAIKKRMLTMERVLGWKEEALAEIFSRLPDITLAITYHCLTSEEWNKITSTFAHSKKRHLTDIIDEQKQPSDAEKSTAIVNILTEVRSMIAEGRVRLDEVDPELIIEDDIEEGLANRSIGGANIKVDTAALDQKLEKASPQEIEEVRREMIQLKKKIVALGNENHNLRRENETMKDKLAKISKLMAA